MPDDPRVFDLVPAWELSPLEVAVGRPFGAQAGVTPLDARGTRGSGPTEALATVLMEALDRPPCLVSFSGGRDSSALLALATKVSREAHLGLPIPATMYFAHEATHESDWQVLVMKQLRLPDWERLHYEPGALDLVGPIATDALARHGLLWPFNAYFHLPIIERAAGGSVVTGIGGDEIGGASASCRAERVWARQERLGWDSSARALSLALAPTWARSAYFRHRFDQQFPWLTRRGLALARRAIVRDDAAEPFGFDRKLHSLWSSRYWQLAMASCSLLARPYDVKMFHPFGDRRFLGILAARGGIPGFGRRADLVRYLFGGLLPEALVNRSSKANFTGEVFTGHSAAFAEGWSGFGLPEEIVEPEWLRGEWSGANPHPFTSLLLQKAWLHDHPSSARPLRGRAQERAEARRRPPLP